MRVLIASINPMHYVLQVGALQYARALDNLGHDVAFFSEPLNMFHLLKGGLSPANRIRFGVLTEGGRRFGQRGMAFTPAVAVPSYSFFPFSTKTAISLSQKTCWPNPKQYLKKLGWDGVDLLWIDNVYYSFLLDLIAHKTSLYRIADHLGDYGRYGKNHLELEQSVIRRADIVVAVTTALTQQARLLRPDKKTLFLPNGVDLAHFEGFSGPEPKAYRDIPRPRAVFVGGLNKSYNPGLIFDLAKTMPDISFVLLGPKEPNVQVPEFRNLYYLGLVPYEDLPAYLTHADVGLAPRDTEVQQKVTMPLKVYQYMASGLPYVSNSYDPQDLQEMNPPGFYVDTPEQMKDKIREAIALSSSQKSRFLHFARTYSWENRIRRVLEAI